MAAYPLPEYPTPPVYMVDAATVVSLSVVPSQPIAWQNNTTVPIHISVQAVNGIYPLTINDFQVPAGHGVVGTFENAVLPNTPLGDYPFTRGAADGGGKIVIR